MEINATVILAFIGAGLALFFDYFPGVAAWFDALAKENKQLLTLGLAVLLAGGFFAAGCYGLLVVSLACTITSAWMLLYDIIVAVATMYGFHAATKPSLRAQARMGFKRAKLLLAGK